MQTFTNIKNVTLTERDALSPAIGTLIYNSTATRFERYSGTRWIGLTGPWPARKSFRVATTTPVTVVSTDYIVAVNLAVAGASIVNLPAGEEGQVLVIKDGKGDSSTNNITINAFSGDLFESGAASTVVNYPFGSWTLLFHSGTWYGIAFT